MHSDSRKILGDQVELKYECSSSQIMDLLIAEAEE